MVKLISTFILSIFLFGCSHISVTNEELLSPYEYTAKSSPKNTVKVPMSIEATMECYERRTGPNLVKKSCSNKSRLEKTVKIFQKNGISPVLVKSSENGEAKLSVKKEPISGFFEKMTGFFNIITLGLSPMYHYDDYVVVYEDPKNNILIKKEARVRSYTSWFSLFMSNPQDLKVGEIRSRTELNLIDAVAREIKNRQ